MIAWELHGMEFSNCNCGYACPCQFNALPTHGHCSAVIFFRVDSGHFGDTRLDGLKMAMAVSWPGAVHQGGGAMQPIIDVLANAAQREGLLSVLTGRHTDPMSTFWAVYAAMCDTIHEPIYTAITIHADMQTRRAECRADGVATGRGEPIVNPITGKEHRVGIVLPNGFEYGQNEVGRGWSSADAGAVPLALEDSYAHWCELHFNQHGRIH
jgi:hypothetical protein